MNEEKKENLENEEVIEKPLELNEETIAKVKEAVADEVRQEAGISEEQSDLFRQMCDEATMPVEFLDKHFKLGDNELDIRQLSKRNLNQMMFRTLVLQNVYLKNIVTSLIDLTRLMLIKLDHDGVEDIVKATDDIIEKIAAQNELNKKQKLVKPENKSN